MIQTAAAIDPAVDTGCAQQLGDSRGYRGRAGRRILQLVERPWKTAEIVDGLVAIDGADRRSLCLPMRRDHEDRLWTGQHAAELAQERPRRCVGERQGRCAVRQEQAW